MRRHIHIDGDVTNFSHAALTISNSIKSSSPTQARSPGTPTGANQAYTRYCILGIGGIISIIGSTPGFVAGEFLAGRICSQPAGR